MNHTLFSWTPRRARQCPAWIFAFLLGFGILYATGAQARVVRPAPSFPWLNAQGKVQSSQVFLGQPVILLIAPSPRDWAFRSQVGQLQRVYERLAAQNAVFFATFTLEPGMIRSNIPFVTVPEGAKVSALFAPPRAFGIAIIGRDGNLDTLTSRVLSGQRICDILNNSYVTQSMLRRE